MDRTSSWRATRAALLIAPTLAACGDPAAQKDATTSSAAAIASPTPSAAPGPSGAVAPSVTASASAAPKKEPPRTGRPSARAWCEAPKLNLLGPEDPSCAFIEVSEWILVACPASGVRGEKDLGIYDRAVPGGGSGANAAELEAAADFAPNDAIVISLRPGTTAKPLFFYRPQAHPEWTREETFTFAMPADGDELSDRSLPTVYRTLDRSTADCARFDAPKPAATTAGSSASPAPSAAPPLLDVEGQPPIPEDAAWDAEKEVLFKGSDALGCKTKVKDAWFRAVCQGKVTIQSVDVERGRRPTQTTAELKDGKLVIQTPYVENTDFVARIAIDGGERFLKLRWAPGKRPYEVGQVTETR
jgi:hypothetical protein